MQVLPVFEELAGVDHTANIQAEGTQVVVECVADEDGRMVVGEQLQYLLLCMLPPCGNALVTPCANISPCKYGFV